MIYLVSYPHSGNTWVRYCTEYLTKLPTHGHQKFSISERASGFLDVDIKKNPVLIKRHELIEGEIKNTDKFIFLIRNPYDCIKIDGDAGSTEFLKYYSLLLEYEKFKGPKRSFEYEELFEIDFLEDFADILGINIDISERFKNLCNNLEFHKKRSLHLYQNKTNIPGAYLKNVPKIFFENVYLKEFKHK